MAREGDKVKERFDGTQAVKLTCVGQIGAISQEDQIEREALDLIDGDRAAQYGDYREQFARYAEAWSAVIGAHVEAWQVAECMAELKRVRQEYRPKHDNEVDRRGYELLADRLRHG